MPCSNSPPVNETLCLAQPTLHVAGQPLAQVFHMVIGHVLQLLQLVHLRKAQTLGKGWALGYAAVLHIARGAVPVVPAHAAALQRLATAHGLPVLAAATRLLQGWVLTAQGQGEAGLVQLHQGLAAWQAIGRRSRDDSFF